MVKGIPYLSITEDAATLERIIAAAKRPGDTNDAESKKVLRAFKRKIRGAMARSKDPKKIVLRFKVNGDKTAMDSKLSLIFLFALEGIAFEFAEKARKMGGFIKPPEMSTVAIVEPIENTDRLIMYA